MGRGRIRIYEKKRGNRQTGSKALGRVGEVVFYGGLLVLGIVGVVILFTQQVIPPWRANHEFIARRCRVLDARVGRRLTEEGVLYRPEIQIQYEVGGKGYRIWTYDIWHYHIRGGYRADREEVEAALRRFRLSRAGASWRVCWYDPADPAVAVLVRGTAWWVWVTLVVPAAFVLIGSGGLLYRASTWSRSAERRAAAGSRGANGSYHRTDGRQRVDYPYVPSGARVTDSPGTRLAFRLPVTSQRLWAMMITLGACLVWNGLLAVFIVIAIRGHFHADHDWILTALLVPLLAVGVVLAYYFVRQFVLVTGIGPTLLEISDQPLCPGRRYQLFLSQVGRLRLKSLALYLRCEEETTYQHGTNTRTETRCVYNEPVFQHARFDVRRGLPFEAECDLEVPPGAMHSFQADHNEIRWKLVVKGSAEGWPDYERSFPVVVCPEGSAPTAG